MKIQRIIWIYLAASLISGCAAPITYYSKTPEPSKPGKIRFSMPGGAYSTVALYKENKSCIGIQRVMLFTPNGDETVYIPHRKYITFSTYIQTPGTLSFQYSGRAFSVPFESGELLVSMSFDKEKAYTRIQKRDAVLGWIPVTGTIERKMVQPFLDSGSWCEEVQTPM